MSDFERDPRTPCKYGSSCYRTNTDHLEKFKHPSRKQNDSANLDRPKKKMKVDDLEQNHSPEDETAEPKKLTPSPKKPSPKKLAIEKQLDGEKNLSIEKESKNENNDSKRALLKDKPRSKDSKKVELKNDQKELIKQLFLVEMPDDFYSFWEMCKTLNKNDPSNALKDIKLELVGPFDVLAGKVSDVYEEDLPDFLRHWRFYYDPPEFQTVLWASKPGNFHLGYYRDDPKEMPIFVASNILNSKNPEKNGEMKVAGQNLFAALQVYLEQLSTDPFSRMKVPKFQKALVGWAKDKGFSLEKSSKQMESRNRKVVAKTFHGLGIVVPVDKKNDVGYRELAATNTMIKKILKGIEESKSDEERTKCWEQLQPVITFANIANDECDFGTTLELGLDLFTFGSPLLHRTLRQLLTTSYSLLGRHEFSNIIQAHLEDRRHGSDLSIL